MRRFKKVIAVLTTFLISANTFVLSLPVSAAAQAWTPAAVSGMTLWLDSTDATTITKDGSNKVSLWKDKSGSGNNATQSDAAKQPTYSATASGGKAALSFVGESAQNMVIPSAAFSKKGTSFVVWKADAEPKAFNALICATNHVSWFDSNKVRTGIDKDTYEFTSSTAISSTNLNNVYIAVADSAATGYKYYLNGNSLAKIDTSLASLAGTSHIGARGGATLPLTGKISEIIYISGSVSDVDRQKIEGYLANKWGITVKTDTISKDKVSTSDNKPNIAPRTINILPDVPNIKPAAITPGKTYDSSPKSHETNA